MFRKTSKLSNKENFWKNKNTQTFFKNLSILLGFFQGFLFENFKRSQGFPEKRVFGTNENDGKCQNFLEKINLSKSNFS